MTCEPIFFFHRNWFIAHSRQDKPKESSWYLCGFPVQIWFLLQYSFLVIAICFGSSNMHGLMYIIRYRFIGWPVTRPSMSSTAREFVFHILIWVLRTWQLITRAWCPDALIASQCRYDKATCNKYYSGWEHRRLYSNHILQYHIWFCQIKHQIRSETTVIPSKAQHHPFFNWKVLLEANFTGNNLPVHKWMLNFSVHWKQYASYDQLMKYCR